MENKILTRISEPYLLVSGIICYRDREGHHYIDKLWHKDLVEHTKYIENLTLAAPSEFSENLNQLVEIEGDLFCSKIHFCDLPNPKGVIQGLVFSPKTIYILWKAIGLSKIVHSGVANWPIPLGWFSTPIAILRKKYKIINIESAFWRIPDKNSPTSWKNKVRAYITEYLNSWCVNHSDLSLFTSEEYKNSLLTNKSKQGHVVQATWINKENIISKEMAIALWDEKLKLQNLKILFAGRLIKSKGVFVLLKALEILSQENLPIHVDILGSGELQTECEKLAATLSNMTQLRLLGTVPYDQQFFKLLQSYHALVIPTLSDEQPRIVYDAYSQALPILASDTTGNQECIVSGITGVLFAVNNPNELALAIKKAANNKLELQKMGMSSLEKVSDMTHERMHYKRWKILVKNLTSLPIYDEG